MTTVQERERRDLSILIFLIPLGILLIIIVGQMAVRMMPFWNVNAGMGSNLDPDASSARPFALLEPILPQILTPMAWAESYLTPDGDIEFPPFLTFEPTATPSPTDVTPTWTDTTPTTTSTITATFTATPTKTVTATPTVTNDDVTDEPTETVIVTATATDTPTETVTVTATATDTPTITVTTTVTDTPTTTPTDTPTATPTDTPSATPTDTPTTVPTGITSTLDTSALTQISPTIPVGTDGPDGNISNLPNDPGNGTGTYTVVSITGNPIFVSLTPDGNYDLAFYEYLTYFGGTPHVELDNIIIGITNDSNGATYYEVFNWGNNIADTNSTANTGTLPADSACVTNPPECDNRVIPLGSLYTDPGTGITTGILIDVDTALSAPPGDVYYNYIILISPSAGVGDMTQIDAIVVTEIPIPPAPPSPVSGHLVQPVVEETASAEIDPTPSLEEIVTEIISTIEATIENLVTSTDEPAAASTPEETVTDQTPTDPPTVNATEEAAPVDATP